MFAGGVLLVAFVVGAVPFSNIVTRVMKGVDLRDTEYKTVSGTSVYRVAGWWALVVSGILDVAKGALGPLLASDRMVLAAIAGGLAIAGHNWSPFLRGQGGRGIAPALGALLVNAWPGTAVILVALVASRAVRRTGLGSFVGEVALAPVLAVTNGPCGALAGGAIAVPMLVKRIMGNAKPDRPSWRVYAHRLLFDNDPGVAAP